ncbi:hypothetical protein BSKO_13160 [Bryopsis sp. KO-2023]|nr:hypothetical protein BSKO_13160 [Bryopsis sp. KO-2023]
MAYRRLSILQQHLDSGGGLRKAEEEEDGAVLKHQAARSSPASNDVMGNEPGTSETENKFITAEEAALLVKDGDWITASGFVSAGCAEALINAIGARFNQTRKPQGLTLITPIVVGNGKGRGLDVLAKEGLLKALVFAWAGTTPGLVKLVQDEKIQAWNFPFGCVAHMLRDTGAGRLGPITRIGMGTYVDPRETGGKKNSITTENMVELVRVGGELRLWYKAPKAVHVALLRGTTADLDGNISFEKEALYLDQLNKAIAVHNSGGTVIVQVERVCDRGTLPTRAVHIPGALVDKVVVAPAPDLHLQTLKSDIYDPSLSGELRAPVGGIKPLPLGERKIIAHRAFFEIPKAGAVVNLGVGMPEGVAVMVATHGEQNPASKSIVMTTEAGVMGGFPRGGLEFGTGQNAAAHMVCSTILDFYNGGGIDIAFLGMAEVDKEGNVNVSNFGPGRMPGCGGFIDISQSSKQVVFMGCHTSGGLKVDVDGGRINIQREGRMKKFCKAVKEKTFAASSARGRSILYVTERAVLRLVEGVGPEIVEIAPGIDLERDVIGQMEFRPAVSPRLKQMDSRVFSL